MNFYKILYRKEGLDHFYGCKIVSATNPGDAQSKFEELFKDSHVCMYDIQLFI
jgi:hypothetical protein